MAKNWKLKPEVPEEIDQKLSEYPKLTRQLLYNRGLMEKKQIDEFLNAKYTDLHDPFLFQDMQKAVDRIWLAIEKKEKICIYGDYDADAVTANAVLQQTFKYLGVDVESYIPDRFTEGYGINLDALLKIKDKGSKIIITVDTGTNSADAADFCLASGIDFIITDHHEIIGPKPKAFALINPKNPDDTYPYHEITGVGVAFKLACGLLSVADSRGNLTRNNAEPNVNGQVSKVNPQWAKWLLDLVAIGTVADCHSLMGENRILVKYGLQVLAKTKWVGLKALIESSGLTGKTFDTYTLGFVLAPRLNAAGRLEHADIALHLLMETNPSEAQKKAAALEEINRRRQDHTLRIMSEAREQAELIKDRKILVIAGEGWSKGVVGLVAGKIAEEYNRPTIVLEKTDDESTGSARTVGEFDVVEGLKFSSEFLVRFGGHKQAAGLTLKTKDLELFYQKLLEYAEANLSEDFFNRSLWLEAELDGSQLSTVNCQLLSLFEPFGVDNFRPKFLIKNAEILSTKLVGAKQQHLQMKFKIRQREIAGIMFNCSEPAKGLQSGDKIDAAAELTEDEWNGRVNMKLRVVDVRQSEVR